jgi:hypothetical protein
VQTKRYVHKADEGRVSFRAQRQRTLEANRHQPQVISMAWAVGRP